MGPTLIIGLIFLIPAVIIWTLIIAEYYWSKKYLFKRLFR